MLISYVLYATEFLNK